MSSRSNRVRPAPSTIFDGTGADSRWVRTAAYPRIAKPKINVRTADCSHSGETVIGRRGIELTLGTPPLSTRPGLRGHVSRPARSTRPSPSGRNLIGSGRTAHHACQPGAGADNGHSGQEIQDTKPVSDFK